MKAAATDPPVTDAPAPHTDTEVAVSAREARDAARRDRTTAKEAEKTARPAARAERRQAKRREREEAKDDHIVEAPPSLQKSGATGRERLAMAAVVVGALGLLCSVILAVGALLAAIEAGTSNPVVSAVFGTCDVLAGPLNGLFTFSGDDAQVRTDLVTRGVASMVYLAIGLTIPSLLRRDED